LKSIILKKKFRQKKIKIVLSSIIILLNGFIWNSNAKSCYAEISEQKENLEKPSRTKYWGFQILSLDSWKKNSSFSRSALQTFFKHRGGGNFKETTRRSRRVIKSNRSLNRFSSLIEKISELRKCRVNPRIQIEKIFLSGIKSFLLKNNLPKDFSLKDLTNNTFYVLNGNTFNKDSFREEESLQSLVNYLPCLNSLTDNYMKIPSDIGKGFTKIKLLSGKGSPFYEKILGIEYSGGYNVLINSSKASDILIKDARRHLSKKKFSKKRNKKAKFCKVTNNRKGFGLKISNFRQDIKKKTISRNKFKIKNRLWNKIFSSELPEKVIRVNNFILKTPSDSNNNQKITNYFLSDNSITIFDSVRVKQCVEKDYQPKFNAFKYLFNKSLKIRKKTIKSSKSIFRQHLQKWLSFGKFKKRKRLLSFFNSKKKIIKTSKTTRNIRTNNSIKVQKKKSSKLWEATRIVKTFNLHNLCRTNKGFYFKKKICPPPFPLIYQLFNDRVKFNGSGKKLIQKNLKKFLNRLIYLNNKRLEKFSKDKFDKKSLYFKENIKLSKKFKNIDSMSFLKEKRNDFNSLLTKTLGEIRGKKEWNFEIFNFSSGLSTIKTEDWKTSVSLLNRTKSFKNSRTLNLLGNVFRFGQELPKSIVRSQKFHNRSAQLGNTKSQSVLAIYLTKGLGVKKNKKGAFLILSKRAQKGIPRGVYNLITMLKNGVGVKKDILRALKISEYSKQLKRKGRRRSYKRHKKVNKFGFFKTLYSYIRRPTEIKTINFYLESFISPITADLSSFIFENAQLISSNINLINISEKQGSFVSRKKLQNLFLENRQQYLFHETLKGSTNTFPGDFTELIFKLNMGIGFRIDYLLLKKISNYGFFRGNIFYKIKIIQNAISILFYQLNYSVIRLYIQILNFVVSFFLKLKI